MMRLAVIIASLLGILIALPLLYVGLFVIRSAWFAPGQRFDIGPNTQFIKRPHFELETRGQIYHWSFESGAFEASRSQSLMRFSRQPCLPSANAQGN